jgi:hypothetical protein
MRFQYIINPIIYDINDYLQNKSKTLDDLVQDLFTELDDCELAKKAIQKLLVHSCAERDFSSQEVLHLATGKKLMSSSRSFVKINFQNEWTSVGQLDNHDNFNDNEVFKKFIKIIPNTLCHIFNTFKSYSRKLNENIRINNLNHWFIVI